MTSAPVSTRLARLTLIVAALGCAIGMVGPFQGVEHALIPWDKAAHFVAFYVLTSLLFLAFPKRRRLDLATLAIFGGCAIEILQGAAGRDAELGDIAANACGVLAVFAPSYLEQVRANLRNPGVRAVERRRGRRRLALANLRDRAPSVRGEVSTDVA